ncbi:MAG: SRPBCC family protein [Candidatus Eremiobacteraeota bacterium]|nr:SRPBCC family protein [Candidatus Eremiobacteraeota bacterium]
MSFSHSFKVSTPSDREIAVTRDFDAPRRLVFDAFTKPELVRRWLLGPPGWTMPLCEIDLRVGGAYRYVWRSEEDESQMAMGGVFQEIIPLERLLATEKFEDAWYPGEAVNTTVFVEMHAFTRTTITMLYESLAARDMARRSGMESGIALGYDRLGKLLLTFVGERI